MTGSAMLKGKVALISGVGPGLGGALVRLFAAQGAQVLAVARNDIYMNDLAAEIAGRHPGACIPKRCDITSDENCSAAVSEAVGAFGRLDMLVNVAYTSDEWEMLIGTDPVFQNWRHCFEVNVFGTMGMTRAVARHFIGQRSGTIVTVNSMLSDSLIAGRGGYQGSKAALSAMTKTAALELAPHGIRINSIHPGWMDGEPVRRKFAQWAEERGTDVATEAQRVIDRIPLGYLPQAAQYANIVLFLASDLSAPMTGQSLHANGGQWLH